MERLLILHRMYLSPFHAIFSQFPSSTVSQRSQLLIGSIFKKKIFDWFDIKSLDNQITNHFQSSAPQLVARHPQSQQVDWSTAWFNFETSWRQEHPRKDEFVSYYDARAWGETAQEDCSAFQLQRIYLFFLLWSSSLTFGYHNRLLLCWQVFTPKKTHYDRSQLGWQMKETWRPPELLTQWSWCPSLTSPLCSSARFWRGIRNPSSSSTF